jgi:hypothetical protein
VLSSEDSPLLPPEPETLRATSQTIRKGVADDRGGFGGTDMDVDKDNDEGEGVRWAGVRWRRRSSNAAPEKGQEGVVVE